MTDIVRLQDEPIDADALVELVRDDSAGAVVSFLGTTRNTFVDETGTTKSVQTLSYEAYGPMALRYMRTIVAEARDKHPGLVHVALVHRLGSVPVGQTSIAVVVSSPHRRAALEAVGWIMDHVKARVPIWKREVYADGSVWKENGEWRTLHLAHLTNV
ncbi:Molybdopterin biosynthesis MoaE [Entophlyctis helioformis]|nr:Molybdopterin biosynthesis MoaE [Entophlyctis helioformis]